MNIDKYEWVFDFEEDELMQSGCVYLGEGSSRTVYAIDKNVVVKVAKDEIGERQNLTEWRVYDTANQEQRTLLAPIYELGQGEKYLLMRRANTNGSKVPNYSLLDPLIEEFNLLLDDLNNTASWGLIEDFDVCIDYGCDYETRKEYDDTMLRQNLWKNVF